jgi:acetoacetyl-CoA reductase
MRILITGSSRGIGKALFEHYRREDNQVYGLSRKDCDLADREQTNRFFAKSGIEELDLAIHCAGINVTRFFYKLSHEAFRQMIDTNIWGTFNLLKNVIPLLKTNGSIILFSSASAFAPRMGQAAYACCKSALHGLAKVLVQEMLVEEKYLYLIAPGIVETGMPVDMMSAPMLKRALDEVPMKRFCKLEELINAIELLQKTPYMTGQTLHLNGSYYVQ